MVEFIRIPFKTRKETYMPTVTAHLKKCAGGHRQHSKRKKRKFKVLEMKKKTLLVPNTMLICTDSQDKLILDFI